MAFQRTFYDVEFILGGEDLSEQILKDYLKNLGKILEISHVSDGQSEPNAFKIHVQTENPHIVFDTCSLFGKLQRVKVEELKKEVE